MAACPCTAGRAFGRISRARSTKTARRAGLGILLSVVSGGNLVAQSATPGKATLTGTVFDSLVANAPLAGAEVVVEGADLSSVSDARGHFRIDGVPAGRTTVRFYHARLDSLGFGAAPAAVAVRDSGTTTVQLATPSAATLHARTCPAPQPPSTGVLLGRVRDVDGRAPLPNATVAVKD